MAGLFVVMVPIILFAFGLQNFIVLIALIGGLLTATEWACVALMWRKSFKRDSIMRMPRMQNANAAKEAVIPAEAGIHLLLPRFSYPPFLGGFGGPSFPVGGHACLVCVLKLYNEYNANVTKSEPKARKVWPWFAKAEPWFYELWM